MAKVHVSFYYWKFLYTLSNEYWWVIIKFSIIGPSWSYESIIRTFAMLAISPKNCESYSDFGDKIF